MLRGENLACGTSTTGTGTLALAAVPSAVGAVDLYAWLTATGIGFVNGNAVLVSYVITEYTDSTFVKPKVTEKGIGTLTLGASLAASTLARTTPQVKADANGDTYGVNPTAFSISTAANTLVFIGPSATDTPAFPPYLDTGGDNAGAAPAGAWKGTALATGTTLTHLRDYYQFFEWRVPMLVKRATVRVVTAYTGGTPVSNAYFRIYAIGTDGQPGKLLIDLGLLGTSNASLNATGNVSTAAHASGFHLPPGEYVANFIGSISGGTGGPAMNVWGDPPLSSGRIGLTSGVPFVGAIASTGTAGAGPDPANKTSYTPTASGTGGALFAFALKGS